MTSSIGEILGIFVLFSLVQFGQSFLELNLTQGFGCHFHYPGKKTILVHEFDYW